MEFGQILGRRFSASIFTGLFCSIADPDPGSGAFLTPGSGIRDGLESCVLEISHLAAVLRRRAKFTLAQKVTGQ